MESKSFFFNVCFKDDRQNISQESSLVEECIQYSADSLLWKMTVNFSSQVECNALTFSRLTLFKVCSEKPRKYLHYHFCH